MKKVRGYRGEGIMRGRPEVLQGITQKLTTGCGNLYVTLNKDENGNPFEVFASIGKAGGCAAAQCETIGRLITLALRSEIEIADIVKQLKGVSCHQANGSYRSCADAIGSAIEEK